MEGQDYNEVWISPAELELKALARCGNAEAQYELGYCLQHGLHGINQNNREAARWFHHAARSGHALAQYRLGVLIARGRVGDADPEAASRWCGKALDQCRGDLLSVLHAEAAGGDPDAKNSLGCAFHKGLGVESDDKRAFDLWFSAANVFCPRASWNVAQAYEMAIGVERSVEQAAYWYRHAAIRGVGRAAHRIALLLIEGTEIPGDTELATRYLRKAVALGWSSAKADLAALEQRMKGDEEAQEEDCSGQQS